MEKARSHLSTKTVLEGRVTISKSVYVGTYVGKVTESRTPPGYGVGYVRGVQTSSSLVKARLSDHSVTHVGTVLFCREYTMQPLQVLDYTTPPWQGLSHV